MASFRDFPSPEDDVNALIEQLVEEHGFERAQAIIELAVSFSSTLGTVH